MIRRPPRSKQPATLLPKPTLFHTKRDQGLFIAFAPSDAPRYAAAVVIEHGGGSGAAYPIARDVMTFLFDREKAMAALEGFEAGWGGTIEERMARDFAAWKAGANRPPPEGAA